MRVRAGRRSTPSSRARHLLGCKPRLGSRPRGSQSGARAADGVQGRRRRSRRGRLRERARHLDPPGDAAETRALKLAFGKETAARLPMSSTKGATGRTLGAAGAVEAIFTILALQTGVLPPTIDAATARPGVRPRLHPERGAPEQPVDVAVEFVQLGGHDAAEIFRRLSWLLPALAPCAAQRRGVLVEARAR